MNGWQIVARVADLAILIAGMALAVIRNPGAFDNLLKAAWPEIWTALRPLLVLLQASSAETQAAEQKRTGGRAGGAR